MERKDSTRNADILRQNFNGKTINNMEFLRCTLMTLEGFNKKINFTKAKTMEFKRSTLNLDKLKWNFHAMKIRYMEL